MMVMMIKLVFKIVKSLKQVQTRPAYLRRGIAGTCLLPDFYRVGRVEQELGEFTLSSFIIRLYNDLMISTIKTQE